MQPIHSRLEPDSSEDHKSEVLDDFLDATVISPSSWWRTKSTWRIGRDDRLEMPCSLERLLDDYNLALIAESPNSQLIRPRLDAILIQILSVVKETRQKSVNGKFGMSAILDAVFWGSRRRLCIAHDFQGCSYTVSCSVDYTLWYGNQQDLETNFIVVRSDVLMEDECWMPLAAMSLPCPDPDICKLYYRTPPSYPTNLDFFEKLRIRIGKSSVQGSAMRSKAAIAEVPVVSRTVAQQGKRPAASENTDLPHITIADIQPQNVRRFLRLQPDPDPGSCWQLTAQDKIQGPEHLGPILSGYWRAAGRDGENKALMRSRLEIILVAVLASKKRESASAYGSLHLQFENSLSLPWSYLNGDYVLEGTTDYSIWYGGQKRETNLLLLCALRRGNIGRYRALSSMAILHHARKRAGRNDTTVYGIVTDTDEWRFLCINNESQVSRSTNR
ncbi:hypothetical protein KXV22_003399 [Aspergillus fumigatus]|nr:hypothetical protein KXX09_006816 [Aspergillus fumigatus]KAH1961043.1 hypothetical protein KXV90_005957 [Aspergillus fumigatus]KAH3581558.1 hypothetical protein KXV22_003399 [Aspergillus fumigatus]KAJ8163031.1 hypothetical protein LV165_003197 [Aspergillus fumigatus]KAJ8164766.1 hypothetical protein LV162_003320 [Aspergillus fumigatus]